MQVFVMQSKTKALLQRKLEGLSFNTIVETAYVMHVQDIMFLFACQTHAYFCDIIKIEFLPRVELETSH